jgi:hypothetical protein
MPRIRSIYPEACRSRKLAILTPAAERCWWRLQCHLDDHGRAEDEPDIFASVLFQVQRDVTPGMVDRWLWEMAEAGLIVRYTVNEKHLIEVCRWGDFQHPQKPKPSTFPPAHSASTRRVRDEYGTTPALFPYGGDGMGEETDTEKEGESEGEPKQTLHNSQPVDNHRLPTPLRERLVQLEANPPVRLTSVEGA